MQPAGHTIEYSSSDNVGWHTSYVRERERSWLAWHNHQGDVPTSSLAPVCMGREQCVVVALSLKFRLQSC